MVRRKVLFVCIHNSARSQMAEAYLNTLGGDLFEAESAGLEPGTLNPLAVAAMQEEGIDISRNRTKDVQEFLRRGQLFDFLITVCDATAAERCPVFPGPAVRLHWGFADPAALTGSQEERAAATRQIRDQIKEAVKVFLRDEEH